MVFAAVKGNKNDTSCVHKRNMVANSSIAH